MFEDYGDYYDCSGRYLTELPKLPQYIKILHCSENMISFLPELPEKLECLYCDHNELTSLPELPKSLISLYCHKNKLKELPELPKTLLRLEIDHNKFEYLPELPDSLVTFFCHKNNWKEPIKIEIMKKFNLEPYTSRQIDLFNSENFQRKFLTEKPERFQDINYDYLSVRPIIRKEFAHLYEGEDMGFFNLKTK